MSRSVAELVRLTVFGVILLLPVGVGGTSDSHGAPHLFVGSAEPASAAPSSLSNSAAARPPDAPTPTLPSSHLQLGHIRPPTLPGGGGPPAAAVVDPYLDYSSEPAPMGLADFGVNANDAAYSYSTSRFLATAHIEKLSTTDSFGDCWSGFQLNVVVELQSGAKSAAMWIQDVPFVCYTNGTFDMVDNVWNLTAAGGHMDSNSVSGNGAVYSTSQGGFYEYEAPPNDPGINANLQWPANFSVEVVESDISGTTHVGFQYNDGFGWVTYDNVTFPWTRGWTDDGFVVNGGAYTPLGIFYDAEWEFTGPGGGSNVNDVSSNLSLALDYFNGHNFEAVPNAFNFGSDTAETSTNVVSSFASRGAPGAVVTAGSGSLSGLYAAGDLATIAAKPALASGGVSSGAAPTNYTGSSVNLTVVPGTYRFTLWNGSRLIGSVDATLSAGGYRSLAFPQLALNASQGFPTRALSASGSGFPANTKVSIVWPGNTSQDCTATASSAGAFACLLTVPYVAAGNYEVPAIANDTGSESGYAMFQVLTNLSVTVAGATSLSEVSAPVRFWANASLGYAPYRNYTWDWGDGTTNTTLTGLARHAFVVSGVIRVNVSVEDRLGSRVWAATTIRIIPSATALVSANPASVDAGQSATFTASASGGFPPYNYTWKGLPPGCPRSGTISYCPSITQLGNYTVTILVNDSDGVVVAAAPWHFTVSEDPAIGAVTLLRPFTDVGQTLSLAARIELGTSPFTFHWNGLPGGCGSITSTLDCVVRAAGLFPIVVTATDAAGITTSPYTFNVTIATDPAVSVGLGNGEQVAVGESFPATASVTGGSGIVSYQWTGLPSGCLSVNASTLPCNATERGNFFVNATVVDRAGYSASGQTELEVFPRVAVGWVRLPRAEIDLGANLSLGAAAIGGVGVYHFSWTGLPSGCASVNASRLDCTPTETGSFRISVAAVDATQAVANTTNVSVTVHPDPVIISLAPTHRPILLGGAVAFSAAAAGGSGDYSYRWSGLPPGCNIGNGSVVECTPSASGTYDISVIVQDGVGGRARASLQATVVQSFLGLTPLEEAGVFGGIAGIAALAIGAMLIGRRAVKVQAPSPRAPAKPSPTKPVRRTPPRTPRFDQEDWGEPDEPL